MKRKTTSLEEEFNKSLQQIEDIMSHCDRGAKASHAKLAYEVIERSNERIKAHTPLLFGNVFFVGYVLGKREERARNRKKHTNNPSEKKERKTMNLTKENFKMTEKKEGNLPSPQIAHTITKTERDLFSTLNFTTNELESLEVEFDLLKTLTDIARDELDYNLWRSRKVENEERVVLPTTDEAIRRIDHLLMMIDRSQNGLAMAMNELYLFLNNERLELKKETGGDL